MKALVATVILSALCGCALLRETSRAEVARSAQFHHAHFQIKDLDRQPMLVSRVEPRFIQDGRYHECITGFIVSSEGIPIEVQFTKATDIKFANACVEAISSWRFDAALKDGKSVPCVMFVPFVSGDPPETAGDKVELLIP